MTDQTAMLLTAAEWNSLEEIAEHFITATMWAANPDQRRPYLKAGEKKHLERIDARRALCKRLIEANR